MRDIIQMIVVLAVLGAASGGGLALVKSGTAEKIEYQQLKFVKGPAIKKILEGCSNDPLVDRFKIKDGDVDRSFFVGVFDGKANAVAYETFGVFPTLLERDFNIPPMQELLKEVRVIHRLQEKWRNLLEQHPVQAHG